MTMTYRDVASALLLTATTISMTYQLYRASVGTNPEVDRFGIEAAVVYAAYYALAMAVRSDRRWVWWTTGLVLTLNLVYGIVGYYPTVYAARPLNVLDWLEGTLYTGLLLAALGCTALRLTGTALAVEPRDMSDAGAPRQFTA